MNIFRVRNEKAVTSLRIQVRITYRLIKLIATHVKSLCQIHYFKLPALGYQLLLTYCHFLFEIIMAITTVNDQYLATLAIFLKQTLDPNTRQNGKALFILLLLSQRN